MSAWLANWLGRKFMGILVAPAGGRAISIELGSGYDALAEEAAQRSRIVDFMRSQVGKPYRLGVEIPPGREHEAQEWDCSEESEAAYRLVGIALPDGAENQYNACQAVKHPRMGDLGFLWSDKRGMIGHVMVASDVNTVIHAVAGRGVVEDLVSMWDTHERWRGWRRHPIFARPPEDRA